MPSKTDQKIAVRGGELILGDVLVPYRILRQYFPDYAKALKDDDFTKEVRVLNLEAGEGKTNYIEFTDGTSHKLDINDPAVKFVEIYNSRYAIKLEHSEEILRAKQSKPRTLTVYPGNVLIAPIHKRTELMRTYLIERGIADVPTKQEWIDQTIRAAKRKLVNSDWTQLPDVQAGFDEEEKAFWLDYRKKCRDAMKSTDPFNEVVLPATPKGSTYRSD